MWWSILWWLWAAGFVRQPTAPVLVSNGWVRGTIAPTGLYKQYVGIPYATIVNRFQAPGPEPKWDGVFEAVNDNIQCKQTTDPFANATIQSKSLIVGQDDCLILNVYSPLTASSSKPLPVMVYIHGGGFMIGSATKKIYGPKYLTNKGVVLVTINYRLYAEGFLCLGIKEAPGNAGLRDQVAALRWVQRNIKEFGGDPENVSIFGQSAGGESVSFHGISPMSTGLFHKMIQQSGSCSVSIEYDPIQKALLKAKAMGYTSTSEDPYDLYNFFVSKTSLEIISHLIKRIEGKIFTSRLIFRPCIETIIEGVEPFLTEMPYKAFSEGRYAKVPIMAGSNSDEAIVFLNIEADPQVVVSKIDDIIPKDLVFPSADERKKCCGEIKNLYLGDDKITIESAIKLSSYPGELYFNYPTLEEIELKLKTNDQPMYSYFFSYAGLRNVVKYQMKSQYWGGVKAVHGDDLFYLFSQDALPLLFEDRMIEIMTTMWTNFAKYGDPTPVVSELLPVRWPPLRVDDQRSLHIDRELTTMPMWYNNDTLPFWKNLYAKYRRKDNYEIREEREEVVEEE